MQQLQDALQYQFKNERLLRLALTHPSLKEPRDNQRLEFLGDAVLEFCISDVLFRKYPDSQERELTAKRAALVCEETLSRLAAELGIGESLRMGHGEETTQGREKPSILCDAMESVLAAVYLDGGMREAYRLVARLFEDEQRLIHLRGKDGKGLLQAYTQANGLGLPSYAVVDASGPDHDKHFVCEVNVGGEAIARGEGGSKKAAEQLAAAEALARLQAKKTEGEGCG